MEWIEVSGSGVHGAALRAAKVMRGGGVAVFPAERIYGLAADARNPEAVRRVYDLKSRHDDKPLPVIVHSTDEAIKWVEASSTALILMNSFWPGPLTLVLPLAARLPAGLVGRKDTLAIRVPGNALALEMARELGGPVTATSANKSGSPPARTAAEAIRGLAGEPDLVADHGELPGLPASTVVLVSGDEIKVLRPGMLDEQEILKAIRGN